MFDCQISGREEIEVVYIILFFLTYWRDVIINVLISLDEIMSVKAVVYVIISDI